MSMCFISELKANVVFPSHADQKQAEHVGYECAPVFGGVGSVGWTGSVAPRPDSDDKT